MNVIKIHHVRELIDVSNYSTSILPRALPGDIVTLRGAMGGGFGLVISVDGNATVFWSQLPKIFTLVPNYISGLIS